MRTLLCTPALLTLFLLPVGCASYRYDVVPATASPDAESMTVLTDKDLVIPADPARLRLRQVESRCVLMVENPGTSEISLESSGSAIVDPTGQSRAIAGQLIPPGSFVKLILPPLRDQPPAGPQFQFGIGAWVDNTDSPRQAHYLDVGRAQDYWEWDGEGRVRIILALKQADKTFRHEFTLQRTKK